MSKDHFKIPGSIADELDRTGLPWRAVVGGKHIKLFMRERLVGVTPRNGRNGGPTAHRNIVAQIRRAAKGLQ